MSTRYKIAEVTGTYYLTFQIVGWVDLFTRQSYRDIAIESPDPSGNFGMELLAYSLAGGILIYKGYRDGKAANNKSNIFVWDPPTSFMIGISSSPDGSNASCFFSVGWSENAMPTVGYSSENGVGFGYSSYSGAHMAYAGYSNNDAITANTDRAIANARAKYNPQITRNTSFFGCNIRFISEDIPYNSYFGGAINTQKSIYNDYETYGLNSYGGKLLMHEYGHFLQSNYGGSFWYAVSVVPTSLYNINTMDPSMYDRTWTEVQANTMSYYYFRYPSYWDFNSYPINNDYISDELKSKLYYHKP